MPFNENIAQEAEPDHRLLNDGKGDILVRLSLNDLDIIIPSLCHDTKEQHLKERLMKARALLEYSTKREAYVKGK